MPKKVKNLRSEPTLQFIQPCLDVHKLSNCDYGDMAIKQHTQKHKKNILDTSREILEEKIAPVVLNIKEQPKNNSEVHIGCIKNTPNVFGSNPC